jgi:glutamate racemase
VRTIGVFDSGKGGISVANAIKRSLPDYQVVFRDDASHLPYGSKSPEELLGYVVPILQEMVEAGCSVIVIACNTVTTTLIHDLRKVIAVPLVGVEPMIKPAAKLSKTDIIAVCATPTTLASKRYDWLKETYAPDTTVLEPDCSDWAFMIESKQIDREKVRVRIDEACKIGADVIVLACTHYHWIEDIINDISAGRAIVIQPETAIIEQLKRVIAGLEPEQPE